jgi:predicted type IV restriction endonuclease
MTSVPPTVVELVETFDRNLDAFKNQRYNEAQLRREFIDPLFESLGWDVANKAGYAPAYKDVIHEDAIKIGGATKAPDYCFRIGPTRKFFLEAKKPSIDIKDDPHPAYQLRRYAWSAKLPLSILTDFEEFAVYDCRHRPKQTDGASTARIIYLTYKDYPQNWDKIADIFSKDAILKGSFDKFAVTTKGKRGTTTVDAEFLAELEKWRAELARIIALKNRALSVQEINFSVQRTIDRILFLRMCEDRGIEHYGQLLGLSTGRETYQRLCQVFTQADAKYNSGLFHFRPEKGRPEPDELTPNITIDDTPLKWILHNLYYPQCPYVFYVLPPEILGNVYEQFLGKVIRLTPAHQTHLHRRLHRR